MDDVPAGLWEVSTAIATGDAVAFVGAGLSLNSGAPSWESLVAELAQELDPAISGVSPQLMTQFYRNQRGDHQLYSLLRRRLSGLRPSIAHELVAALPITAFLTTNYDDLLEVALRNVGKRVHVISDDAELSLWQETSEVQVLKVHGDLDRARSIVLTEEDYARFLHQNQGIQRKLLDVFCYRTVFFIGYSMQDPNINWLYNQVVLELGSLKRPAYTFTFDQSPHQWREWKRRGIQPIFLSAANGDRPEALRNALSSLAQQVRSLNSDSRCDLLVVEDDLVQLDLFRFYFDHYFPDIKVEYASDGLEASLALGKLRPRVLCVDIMMPRMDGFQLIEALRRDPELRDTRIVIASAYVQHEGDQRTQALGVDQIFRKPFELREFGTAVANLVQAQKNSSSAPPRVK
jgi:CheY-like chemotaxis protein